MLKNKGSDQQGYKNDRKSSKEAIVFDSEGIQLSGVIVPESIMLDENGNELILQNGNTTFEAKMVIYLSPKDKEEYVVCGLLARIQNLYNPYSMFYAVSG